MKKILLLIALFAVSMVSCVSKSEYRKKMGSALSKMEVVIHSSFLLAEDHRNVWYKAIYDDTYRGRYCSDFNEALADNKKNWAISETV